MKIISVHVENYGILHQLDMDFSDGINTITHENGWGKSTLMSFIRAMFYGLSNTSKRDLSNERLRFSPWQGGLFGGQMRFEAGGREYTVIRSFSTKGNKNDFFELRSAVTGLVCSDYSERLGEELFGIDSDSFSRSAYIGQNCMAGGVTDDINAKIGNLTDNTNDINNYENASEIIRKALAALSPAKSRGSIYTDRARINELEAAIRNESSVDDGIKRTLKLIDGQNERKSDLLNENAVLNARISRISSYANQKSLKESCDILDENIRECRHMLENSASVFPGDIPDEGRLQSAMDFSAEYDTLEAVNRAAREPVPTALATVFPAAAVVLFIIAVLAKIRILFVPSALLIIAGVIIFFILKKKKDARLRALSDAEALRKKAEEFVLGMGFHPSALLTKQLYVISGQLRDYRACEKALLAASKRRDDFLKENGSEFLNAKLPEEASEDISALSDKLQNNLEEIRRIDAQNNLYSDNIETLSEKLDEISSMKSELEMLREKVNRDIARYSYIEKAGEFLTQAKNNLTGRYIGPIKKSFDRYYSIATGTSAENFYIDSEAAVTFDEQGSRHETVSLSRGRQDLVSFCLRLALIDAMYDDERPPVFLDDPFVNLSLVNEQGCMRVLEALSHDNQLFYFSCRPSHK